MDEDYDRQILETVEKITAITEDLDQRLSAIETALGAPPQPQPHQGYPYAYLSGRWYMRSGMGFGGPPGS